MNQKELKENLRECTRSENSFNTNIRKDNTSEVKGVSWHKENKKWQVYVGKKYIGQFDSKKGAAKARKQAEKKLLC